ncbi:MAG: 30S ribosomal protein S7 [Candidatus Woesearchaeota archaeon]|nr:30S ribosomal protein S7 [Candidatus Woesearchaeota archaeon]
MAELKAFNKWSTKDIIVTDIALKDYINLEAKIVPKTEATYAGSKFYKSRVFIAERLINKLMVPGHKGKKHKFTSSLVTGKGQSAYHLVEEALTVIERQTKKNPIQVLVTAIENSAPREDIVSIEYGGARYPKAVDCSPQRRIDVALRYMVQGAYAKTFNTRRKFSDSLAYEITEAYNMSANSNAIAKKLMTERQTEASR